MRILYILSLLLFSISSFSQNRLIKLIKKSKPAVCTILTYDDSGTLIQMGSGFFISETGDVVTNYHVLSGGYCSFIENSDGIKFIIDSIIGWDDTLDICKLKICNEGYKFKYLKFNHKIGKSGQKVFTIGSPGGYKNTSNIGIICSERNLDGFGEVYGLTIPITGGMSGSPVIEYDGKVIGIITFVIVEEYNYLNFAISSENIKYLKRVSLSKLP